MYFHKYILREVTPLAKQFNRRISEEKHAEEKARTEREASHLYSTHGLHEQVKEEQTVNALAPSADEGRDTLRKAETRCV